MLEELRFCSSCVLCQQQKPLLAVPKQSQVFWVGLSAKKITYAGEGPLAATTNSGKLLDRVAASCPGISFYKTNLVKGVPLDERQQLRYPNNQEINACFSNLEKEINALTPKIVFLLGTQVTATVGQRFGLAFKGWEGFAYGYLQYKQVYYIPIQHPSYIYVYKRKQVEEYLRSIEKLISALLQQV